MIPFRFPSAAAVLALGSVCNVGCAKAAEFNAAPARTLTAFHSEKELKKYLSSFPRQSLRRLGAFLATVPLALRAGNVAAAETITNTQHAGVDEGDLVKLHGQYLVVLRRGRLFTVDISDGRLQPVSSLNAFGPRHGS